MALSQEMIDFLNNLDVNAPAGKRVRPEYFSNNQRTSTSSGSKSYNTANDYLKNYMNTASTTTSKSKSGLSQEMIDFLNNLDVNAPAGQRVRQDFFNKYAPQPQQRPQQQTQQQPQQQQTTKPSSFNFWDKMKELAGGIGGAISTANDYLNPYSHPVDKFRQLYDDWQRAGNSLRAGHQQQAQNYMDSKAQEYAQADKMLQKQRPDLYDLGLYAKTTINKSWASQPMATHPGAKTPLQIQQEQERHTALDELVDRISNPVADYVGSVFNPKNTQAVKEGWNKKRMVSGEDIVNTAMPNMKGSTLSNVIGTGLDIAEDPINLVPFAGLEQGIAKVGTKLFGERIAAQLMKIAAKETLSAVEKLILKTAENRIAQAVGKVGTKAAKYGATGGVFGAMQGFGENRPLNEYPELMKQNAEMVAGLGLGGEALGIAAKGLAKGGTYVASKLNKPQVDPFIKLMDYNIAMEEGKSKGLQRVKQHSNEVQKPDTKTQQQPTVKDNTQDISTIHKELQDIDSYLQKYADEHHKLSQETYKSLPSLYQDIRAKGGIKESKDTSGEYRDSLYFALRSKHGKAIDEMASEMGFNDSRELLDAIVNEKVNVNKTLDHRGKAEQQTYKDLAPVIKTRDMFASELEKLTGEKVNPWKYEPTVKQYKERVKQTTTIPKQSNEKPLNGPVLDENNVTPSVTPKEETKPVNTPPALESEYSTWWDRVRQKGARITRNGVIYDGENILQLGKDERISLDQLKEAEKIIRQKGYDQIFNPKPKKVKEPEKPTGKITKIEITPTENKITIEKPKPQEITIYRRDIKDANLDAEAKPHGLYTSLVKDKNTFKSPHMDVGDTDYWGKAKLEKPLVVDTFKVEHARFGNLGSGEVASGVAALKKLVPEKEFNRLLKLSKKELISELNQKHPGPDYTKYYDSYELLEAYGGMEARKQGYDAIIQHDNHVPMPGIDELPVDFSEAVLLKNNAKFENSAKEKVMAKIEAAKPKKMTKEQALQKVAAEKEALLKTLHEVGGKVEDGQLLGSEGQQFLRLKNPEPSLGELKRIVPIIKEHHEAAIEYAAKKKAEAKTEVKAKLEKAANKEPKSEVKVTSKDRITASVEELAADYKARGIERNGTYSQFVKDRALKPEIDNKQFQKIYDSVSPKLFKEGITVEGKPVATHILKETTGTEHKVMILEDNKNSVSWITENGMTGSTPKQFIEHLKPIDKTKSDSSMSVNEKNGKGIDDWLNTVSKDDIDFKRAVNSYNWNSMDPERRARGEQDSYVKDMQTMYEKLKPLAKTPNQEAILVQELEKYKERYLKHKNSILDATSRTASPMVTGPAKFPTARNEKALNTEHKRITEFLEWHKKAEKSIFKRLEDSKSPEEKSNDVLDRLKKDVNSTVATLKGIENGDPYSPALIKSNFSGRLKRAADNGQIQEVKQALEYLKEIEGKHLKKPVFAKNNSIWNYTVKVEEKIQAAPKGEVEAGQYNGAKIVHNNDLDRVQIFFDEKPTPEVKQSLKKEGWHYSPTNNHAWQRKLTNGAKYSAENILNKHFDPATLTDTVKDNITLEQAEAKLHERLDENIDPAKIKLGNSVQWLMRDKVTRLDKGDNRPEYAFESAEANKRFDAAEGVPLPKVVDKVRENLIKNWHNATRVYEHMPHTPFFAQAINDLKKFERARGVAAEKTDKILQSILVKLDRKDYELFTKKLVMDNLHENYQLYVDDLVSNLPEDVKAKVEPMIEQFKDGITDTNRPQWNKFIETLKLIKPNIAESYDFPFGFTLDDFHSEKSRIDNFVEGNENVKEAINNRSLFWTGLKNTHAEELGKVGFDVGDKLTREHYYRQQVLEHMADNQVIRGQGKRLKTPTNSSYLKRRVIEGTGKDFNTHYIQAEYEVVSQMMYDVEAARTIQKINDSYNIIDRLKKEAIDINDENIMPYFEQMAERVNKENFDADPEAKELTADDLYKRLLNKKQAMGFKKIEKLAQDGTLPTGPNGEYEKLVENIALGSKMNQKELFNYLSYVIKLGQEGTKETALIFKGIREKKDFIKRTLGRKYVTWQDIIPDSHTDFQPQKGNIFYLGETISEKLARQIQEGALEGIGVTKDDLTKKVIMGGKRTPMIIPNELALTLENLKKPVDDTGLKEIASKSMKVWKQYQLHAPMRYAKYSLRNISSDVDKAITSNPKALLKVKRSISELYQYFYGDRGMTPELKDWFERGGFESLQQAQELGEINHFKHFERFVEKKQRGNILKAASIPKDAVRWWFKFARKSNDFREAVLRYADYLDRLEYMKANNGKPKNFGFSKPGDVMALNDIKDRAFKMSNEQFGAYDMTSVSGQQVAKYIYPFWRFQETNIKGYLQGFKNAAANDELAGTIGRKLLGTAIKSPIIAYRVGKFTLMASAMYGALQSWNNWGIQQLYGEDIESQLPPDVQGRPHVILGKDTDGKPIYFDRVGAFSDFLDWFGADTPIKDAKDYLNGRKTIKEIATDMITAAPNKLYQGSLPIPKLGGEILFKRTSYPDIFKEGTFKPQTAGSITNRYDYFFKSFGLEHEYRQITGKPDIPYTEALKKMLIYKTDAEEQAYYQILDLKDKFKEQIGKGVFEGSNDSPKSEAARYLKQALRYGDKKAAEKYLGEYIKAGGTPETLQKSMAASNPLYGLNSGQKKGSANEQQAFIDWLKPNERIIFEKAMKYYLDTFGEFVKKKGE